MYQWKISTRSRMVDQDFVGKRLERCQVALSPSGDTTAVTPADGRLLLVKGSAAVAAALALPGVSVSKTQNLLGPITKRSVCTTGGRLDASHAHVADVDGQLHAAFFDEEHLAVAGPDGTIKGLRRASDSTTDGKVCPC